MENFKTEFKQLYNSYDKQLQKLQKASLDTPSSSIDYFVTYLKFLRDKLILTENLVDENGEENLKIASIASAITMYEKSQVCENLRKTIAGETEEAKALNDKYLNDKSFYLNNFWALVKMNLEAWTTNA